MKFYYNEKLMRTSKTHHYAYAVINVNNMKCLTCSATKKGCEDFIQQYIRESEEGINNANNAINAINHGHNYYWTSFGRKTYRSEIDKPIEYYKNWIERNNASIKWRKENWKIVELEERA